MANLASKKILVINGPNLNLLGVRNPKIYGNDTLQDIQSQLIDYYKKFNVSFIFVQTNHEGEIIDKLHEFGFFNTDKFYGIVLNPGAFAHSSYAIRDAIEAIDLAVIEVHLSDVYSREKFRKNMLLSDVCKKTIIGEGKKGYFKAVDYLLNEKE